MSARSTLCVATISALVLVATRAAAEPTPPPGMEFDSYYLVFLRRPERPKDYDAAKLEQIQREHLKHIGELYRSGKALAAGPFEEQDNAADRGLLVFPETLGKDVIRKLVDDDPAIKAGRLHAEIVRWFTQKGTAVFPHPAWPSAN